MNICCSSLLDLDVFFFSSSFVILLPETEDDSERIGIRAFSRLISRSKSKILPPFLLFSQISTSTLNCCSFPTREDAIVRRRATAVFNCRDKRLADQGRVHSRSELRSSPVEQSNLYVSISSIFSPSLTERLDTPTTYAPPPRSPMVVQTQSVRVGHHPVHCFCPYCHQQIVTRVDYVWIYFLFSSYSF